MGIFRRSAKSNWDRLFNRDFPWLWAVRTVWTGLENIRVCQDLGSLRNILISSATSTDKFELWATYVQNGIIWKVERVESKTPGASWGQEVNGLLFVARPFLVCCLTTVIGDNITIYRHPDGPYSLDVFVEEVAELFEATNTNAPRVSRGYMSD